MQEDPYDAIIQQIRKNIDGPCKKKYMNETSQLLNKISSSIEQIKQNRQLFLSISDNELLEREKTHNQLLSQLQKIQFNSSSYTPKTTLITPSNDSSHLVELSSLVTSIKNNANSLQTETLLGNKKIDSIDCSIDKTENKLTKLTSSIKKVYSEISSSKANILIFLLFLIILILFIFII